MVSYVGLSCVRLDACFRGEGGGGGLVYYVELCCGIICEYPSALTKTCEDDKSVGKIYKSKNRRRGFVP